MMQDRVAACERVLFESKYNMKGMEEKLGYRYAPAS